MMKTARVLFYCLIVWAPLLYGSNRSFAWVINGTAAAIILALFLADEFGRSRRLSIDMRPATLPLVGITIWSVWMVAQTLPGLPSILHHPIWTSFGSELTGTAGTISIAPASTWATTAQVVPILFLSVFAMRLAFNRSRGLLLLRLIAITSVGVAAYGMLAQYFGFQQVPLITDTHEEVLTGTFVGRNAAATYFALGLAVSASLLLMQVEFAFGRWRATQPSFAHAVNAFGWAAFWLSICVVLIAAIFATGSRGGVAAGLLSLLTAALFWVWRAAIDWRVTAGVLVAATVAVAAAMFASSATLISRLEVGVANADRFLAHQDTIDMILARPILGHGAGTFVDAYPLFHLRASSEAIWNAAHNSYLQAAAGLGLPVFVVVLLTIGSVVVFIGRRLARRKEPAPVAIAAMGAVAAVAAQSTVDFSIQFQAVGLTLVALLGAGLGEAMVLSYEASRTVRPVRRSREASFAAAGDGHAELTYVTFDGADAPQVSVPRIALISDSTSPRRAADEPDAGSANLPDRLYVFGDVHGRVDLLMQVKTAIERDRDRAPANRPLVVGLGDYIDRGGSSKEVIAALLAGFGCRSVFLRGNHEQMLLDFLRRPGRAGRQWIQCGALETLRSYGVDTNFDMTPRQAMTELRSRLLAVMPAEHIAFLQDTKLSYQTDKYFFAHAGVRPGIALEDQDEKDLLWIKEGFSDLDVDFGKVIVHGHTAVDKPYFGKSRINLDTGAYVTNRLTCLVIEEGERRLLDI